MKTGADYARTYRNKQREKVERYEAALREIVEMPAEPEDIINYEALGGYAMALNDVFCIADAALNPINPLSLRTEV